MSDTSTGPSIWPTTSVIAQFITLTIVLTIGMSAAIGAAFRVNVSANWNEKRCDPYVVPMAGFFKPSTDPRSAAQFATDNWSFCQKEYIQNALRTAAEVPQALADAEAASVGVIQDIASTVADVFFSLWNVCHETYSTFMDQMKVVAKKFHNFMINLYSMTERLNSSILSIIYGLIALIVTILNSVQVTLLVTIIVIGIIVIMQIILFFFLLPISGLIITVTALVSVVVVAVTTAIAAAMVAELFESGACFAKSTPVLLRGGKTRPIEAIKIGDVLIDGGRVTAVHTFRSSDAIYNLRGVRVTGDHLVHLDAEGGRVYVSEHPDSVKEAIPFWPGPGPTDLWCLTTSTRRIPCVGISGETLMFADWEEIDDDDTDALKQWFRTVWFALNGKSVKANPVCADYILESESGLAPDCRVLCQGWFGRRVAKEIRDIWIGDRVYDSPDTTTLVVGKVVIAGDQSTDAVALDVSASGARQLVSCACWVKQDDRWNPAAAGGKIQEFHVIAWEQLYTQSGQFMLESGQLIRDASDVGLSALRPFVEDVVLKRMGAS